MATLLTPSLSRLLASGAFSAGESRAELIAEHEAYDQVVMISQNHHAPDGYRFTMLKKSKLCCGGAMDMVLVELPPDPQPILSNNRPPLL